MAAEPKEANDSTARSTQSDLSLERLLTALCSMNLLSLDQRREIEVKAPSQTARLMKEHGGHGKSKTAYEVSPAELIASFKLMNGNEPLDDERLSQAVAKLSGLPYLRIDPLTLDADVVTQTLSAPFARRFIVLPLTKTDSHIEVAVADPYNRELLENLKRTTGLGVKLRIASKRDILKAITEVYGFRRSVQAAARDMAKGDKAADTTTGLSNLEQLVQMRGRTDEIEANDRHIVNAVEYLFHYAFDQKASDIHIEPKREHSQIRFRIDGILHDVNRIPAAVHAPFVARIKTLCRMDIAEKRRPQDGRIKTARGTDEVEIRVSSLPVAFGEKLVLRIFDPESLVGSLPDLGFPPRDFALFGEWMNRPHGLILITGPTGSGKTTTLYTALKTLSDQSVNVTSVEDPIELVFEGFNQVAVQPKIDFDFAAALRTLLRQDPDVIMVGEIRDRQTVDMTIQAAMTGHLLLSTLHTNDSVSAITRLIDLGAEPFLIASTVVGVMAQRLVRKVCANCAEDVVMTDEQRMILRLPEGHYVLRNGRGCAVCRGTGHKGRSGIFELLPFTPELRSAISAHPDLVALQRLAKQQGLVTLREAAVTKLLAGVTSFDEVAGATVLD